MNRLTLKDLILLGSTNFALYVGAGNIIFPPFIGLNSGEDGALVAILGFLLTGVGLPVFAAIALARVGGSLNKITNPIGLKFGIAMTVLCYLAIGPFYAIPRTATVAYEIAITPFTSEGANHTLLLAIYSIVYFVIALLFALYPAKILDTVGKILSPIKILSLFILCVCAIFILPSEPSAGAEPFKSAPFSQGIVNGYLTLDTLASLAFGTVIVDAIRTRNVSDPKLITRYATISGCIAGFGLMFIYICLFRLGSHSSDIAANATNGAVVLSAYVHYVFGSDGDIFLAILIIAACIVTAIGLTCACSAFFSKITGIDYKYYVIAIASVSCLISNLGLTQLIQLSVPILMAVYPAFVMMVIASYFRNFLHNKVFAIAPPTILALAFGVVDGFDAASIAILPKSITDNLPLYSSDLAWLIPSITLFVILLIVDRVKKVEPSQKEDD